MTEQTKTCTGCGETKPLDEYSKDKSRKDGRQRRCKPCRAAYHAEHAAEKAAYDAKYYAEHRAEKAAYDAANPHVRWTYGYRRRARRFGLEEVVEDFTKTDVIEQYGDACHYCGVGDFERLDHYVPVSAGGPHTLDNVRPSCSACDRAKYVTPGPDYEANQLEQSKARHPAMGVAS